MKQILLWYQMTKYFSLSHTFLPFGLALKLFSVDLSQILRDARNELLNTQIIHFGRLLCVLYILDTVDPIICP